MKINSYDILVAKDFETNKNGVVEKKTAWNRVGRAWPSKSGDSINLEFFMIPGQRYVVQLKNKSQNQGESNE